MFLGEHLSQECGVDDVLDMNGSFRVGAVDLRDVGDILEFGLLVEEVEPDPDVVVYVVDYCGTVIAIDSDGSGVNP